MDDDTALILAIERVFGISLPADGLASIDTLGDMCGLVVDAKNAPRPSVPFTFEQIWPGVQEVAADVLGVNADDLTPDLGFHDLNM